ncbi:RNA polymerase sigma-70 factor [Pontibacter amylolyticus]|uniref:DNA-directed RNA polymerase sigma-70 factor n=1 Tax=Pontibacter amylolyticus TaxID=1424080 RepID=A0ABQ1WDJ1_9BACT|nr:RNA polymerase sigma-70 factor [Pontibacter amylolyticus]GGG26055.1 DNA-directed RNA polymerase sigma-70 factor [Pontibacter amylolyticus]
MLQNYTDDMLLVLIQGSDEDAFTELFQRYWKQLYATALKRMAKEEEAKDLVQELFVKLWMRRSTIPEDAKAAEYLYTALRYRIINYFQADQVRLKYANTRLAEQDYFTSSTAESSIALEELESVIEQAMADMPARMQEIFMLSYKNGYTPKEIALQLSLSVQTVKNYLTHARTLLKGRLMGQNPELYAQLLLLGAVWTVS